MTIHPCRVQWRGQGRQVEGLRNRSLLPPSGLRHFKAMIVVVVDRWREEKTTL